MESSIKPLHPQYGIMQIVALNLIEINLLEQRQEHQKRPQSQVYLLKCIDHPTN